MKSMYRRQFAFVIFLIVVLPIAFFINFISNAYSFEQTQYSEAQNKAVLLSDSFGTAIADKLDQNDQLQNTLVALQKKDQNIEEITVYHFRDNTFNALASTSADKQLDLLKEADSNPAWKENRTIATLQPSTAGNHFVWATSSPLRTSDGTNIGLLYTKYSTSSADAVVAHTYYQSFYVLLATVAVILLLLIAFFISIGTAKKQSAREKITAIKEYLITKAIDSFQVPLVIINRNYLALLKAGYDHLLDQKGEQYLMGMYNHARALTSSARDLLDLNKLMKGEASLQNQTVNPNTICAETLSSLENLANTWSIKLHYTPPTTTTLIQVDLSWLSRVISTLIATVMQHMLSGIISIENETTNAEAWTIIIRSETFKLTGDSDVSEGPPEAVEQDYFTNLGVSFWVAKQVVEKMGGQLQTDFQPGQGIVLTLSFPTVKPAAAPAPVLHSVSEQSPKPV